MKGYNSGGYEIKGYKKQVTHDDSECFAATLYRDGKKVAQIFNDGWGGPDQVDFISDEEERLFDEHVKSQPTVHSDELDFDMEPSWDLFIDHLLDEMDLKKAVARYQKKGYTPFILKGDEEGSLRYVRANGEKAIEYLKRTYGDQIEKIYS